MATKKAKRGATGGRRRRPGLAGTNLGIDPRTGIYIWRRKHPLTRKRIKRSTGTRLIDVALMMRRQFEEEFQREVAGLSKFKGYARELAPFLEEFLSAARCGDERRDVLRVQLNRAFQLLKLVTLADLENFVAVEQKLLRLEGSGRDHFSRKTLVRAFQAPLKQFSSYLASRRQVLADHLAPWRRLKVDEPSRKRRALAPEEMARALAASDALDVIFHRKNPMRPVWTALLVAAPRISAFAALDVKDLDREAKMVRLTGRGNKRPGAGALDDKTFAEVMRYVGDRRDGPLFLSPNGARITPLLSLDQWRAAVSLAAVDMEWPDNRRRDLMLEYTVHLALTTGKVRAALGGPKTGKKWAYVAGCGYVASPLCLAGENRQSGPFAGQVLRCESNRGSECSTALV